VIYRIRHRTRYEYAEPVTVSHHAARLQPRTAGAQECTQFHLAIEPEPAVRTTRTDYFGNTVCVFSVQQLHRRLAVLSESLVRLEPDLPPDPQRTPAWEEVAARWRGPVPPEELEAQQFIYDSPQVACAPDLAAYAAASFTPGRPLLEAARDLTRRLHADFAYDTEATTISTTVAEVLRERRGVCQDFTHLALGCLRSLGLPARYVSGYLRTHAAGDRPRLVGADASHAWFAVHCPGYGWVDFDPTNDAMPAHEHVTVAVGRDYQDVSPLSGLLVGGGRHAVRVAVEVEPA
jgi:transglutaminase-like putative cysteine protease